MKTNFKTTKSIETNDIIIQGVEDSKKELSVEEFEAFIIKSGASGSFMIFISDKKSDEYCNTCKSREEVNTLVQIHS